MSPRGHRGGTRHTTLWRTDLRLNLQGGCVGEIGGEAWLFACARDHSGSCAYLIALDGLGRERWRREHHELGVPRCIGVQPHRIQYPGGDRLVYGHTRTASASHEATRTVVAVCAEEGSTCWTWTDPGLHGLNRDVLLLPEGHLLVGPHDCLVCLDAHSGAERWRYDRGVRICWGKSASLSPAAGRGPLTVLGTEWGNADGSSSLLALTASGEEAWRRDGFAGDLGSTATFAVDVNGDGRQEIAHVELDLEGRAGMARSRLWLFDDGGAPLLDLPFGGSELCVADLDGDGHVEAVGATVCRDGGRENEPEILCLDLTAATIRWRLPLDRWWLANWPVAADVDGDGLPEVVVGTGNPGGYGRVPQQKPWGDLLLVRADGSVYDRVTREGAWSFCQLPFPCRAGLGLACLWDDGRIEVLVWE